jgi:hypothetical protein
MTRWEWLKKRFIATFWQVDKPVLLMLNAPPNDCINLIKTTSKPSISRLHHRNLFADGRRYHLEPTKAGFRMTTTHKIWWQYRRRSAFSAVMDGFFSPFGDNLFRLRLETHIRLFYLIDIFLLPAFMTSLLIYTPWHPLVIGGLSALLLGLSWVGHRFNVALEANEMVWFVRNVLEDHLAEVEQLMAGNPHVVALDQDFEREWQRFYSTQRKE